MADAGRVQREPLAGIAAAPMTARRPLWRRLLPWYWASGVLGLLLWIPILWFLLAYAGLPRLWSHHEHKVLGERDAIVSYTAQDIPGDPINLRLKGSEAAIRCAFQRAGWHPADPVSVRSAIGIATSVLFRQPYPDAPVSPLYFEDKAHQATPAAPCAQRTSSTVPLNVALTCSTPAARSKFTPDFSLAIDMVIARATTGWG